MGEPVKVFGKGGGGGVVVDDTLFNREEADVAILHRVEEAADDVADEEEALDAIDPSLSFLRVVNGSTGL